MDIVGLILFAFIWGGLTLGPATAAWLSVRFRLPGGPSGCAVCGYDLSGTPEGWRCPECGVERADARSVLPPRPALWRFWSVLVAAVWPSALLVAAHYLGKVGLSNEAGLALVAALTVALALWFVGTMRTGRSGMKRRVLSSMGVGALVGAALVLFTQIVSGDLAEDAAYMAVGIGAGSGWGLSIGVDSISREAKLRRREAEARAVGSDHG